MLSGCMATDPSLTPRTTFAADSSGSSDLSGASDFAMVLPDAVTILPTPSGNDEPQVAYAEPVDIEAASFAGPQPGTATANGPFPPAPAQAVPADADEQIFLEPQPAAFSPRTRPFRLPEVEGGSDEVNQLIEKYAQLYDVPVQFVRRVVRRESTFNPAAYNNGHWGLMQIKYATARGMGYRGPPRGLLDAETNLKYAVRYLRGAWMVAQGNPDFADRLYQSGYYYHAKRMGLLDETGLGRDRIRKRRPV